MPKVVKNLLFLGLGACFIWVLSACFLWLSASAESVRDWEGGTDYVEENGRAGIVFNAGEQTFLGIYTKKTYNMNEGITIRFRVNSIPGVQGDADEAVKAFLSGSLMYNPDVKCSHHEHHGEGHDCSSQGGHHCGGHCHG